MVARRLWRSGALALAAVLAAGTAVGAGGDGWPQYRGSYRDGVISPGGPDLAWPEAGPAVLWKLEEAGSGFSQMAVAGGDVYTGLAEGDEEYAVRLDGATGREVWRTPLGSDLDSQFGDGPRATPTLDGDRLYMLSGGGVLHALKVADGSPLWSVNLIKDLGAEQPRFGYSPSPLVVAWMVLLEVGGSDGRSLVAFDRGTGETVWSVLSGPAGYSSPVVAELAGERQIVLPRGNSLMGLSLRGETLWSFELEEPAIAMPIAVSGDRVFVSSMGDTGCALVKVTRGPDGFTAEAVWKNRNMRNHFNSSLVLDGHIYGFDNATLKCLDLETGEVRWAHRGLGKGSLIAVGRRLVVLSDKGELLLVEATPESYRELGRLPVLEGKSWTAPSYADGRVYLRNLSQMACVDLRG